MVFSKLTWLCSHVVEYTQIPMVANNDNLKMNSIPKVILHKKAEQVF